MASDLMLKSPFPDMHIPDNVSYGEFILQRMARFGDRLAYIQPTLGVQMTYAEVSSNSRKFASAMFRKGFQKQDVVLIFSPNSIYYPIALYGNALLGLISSTINPNYKADELQYFIENCEPKCIITTAEQLPTVREALRGTTQVTPELLMMEKSQSGIPTVQDIFQHGDPDFRTPFLISPRKDVCLLPYSSGTTGRSKGVCLTHYNIVANVTQSSSPSLDDEEEEITVAFMPFYHASGLVAGLGMRAARGGFSVIMEKFDFKQFLEHVQHYKATKLIMVPPVAVLLAKSPLTSQYDFSTVRSISTGAAPLDSNTEVEVTQRTGVTLFNQGYGMTEASCVISHPPVGQPAPGSSGFVMPNTQVLIVDIESRRALGPLQDGEILVRGPQMMKSYWRNPAATRETFTPDGWFKTGDIGHYDKDGYIFVVDRLKELIKWKGFQVPPAEVEALLLKHPAVADAAVIGVPDRESGELPRAYVVLKDNSRSFPEQELVDFVKKNASPHKQLRGGVKYVSELPKSPSGKIERRRLREQVKKELRSKI